MKSTQFCLQIGALLWGLCIVSPTHAQITSDGSLTINSRVKNQNGLNTITGGVKSGTNLFHSFEQFSLPTGSEVYFNNTLDVQNIISRVTGSSTSSIDGLIRTNGITNLFLINPSGITFGPNARLNIGGSFLASTADSVNFADGTQFGAGNSQATSLLTVAVPIGLEFGSNPGGIRVQGPGNNVTAISYQPGININQSGEGLQVAQQRTLALVGGDLALDGGLLSAQGGRIELGSVENGLVTLGSTNNVGWSLGYEGVSTFRDIRLANRSLANASGIGSGSIQVQGGRVQLDNGSLILIQNQGPLPTGTLEVNASKSLEISDFSPLEDTVYSGIWSETLGLGDGGKIIVSTPELSLQSSGQIYAATYGDAKAADISLTVPRSLRLDNLLSEELGGGTLIASLAIGTGRSGDIDISTRQLNIANGGVILSANVTPVTFGLQTKGSGNISITASDVEVNGYEPGLSVPSLISAATFSTGKAGDVTIRTNQLRVLNGGRVDSSTTALGIAGTINVEANDLIEVRGVGPGSNPSRVSSDATNLSPDLEGTLGLDGDPGGLSGEIKINTQQLIVADGAEVSVGNQGRQRAGALEITADSINLDNEASITATAQGNGGNIEVLDNNLLLLQNDSSISASASGTGGNINVNTDLLATLGDSTFTATSVNERGGNIRVNAQGVFLPPNISFEETFNASSEQGPEFAGLVEVNTPDVDLSRTASEPPAGPETPTVNTSCQGSSAAPSSNLAKNGTGGLPASRVDTLSKQDVWQEPQENSQSSQARHQLQQGDRFSTEPPEKFVQAVGWISRPDGKVDFIASDAKGPSLSLQVLQNCLQTNS